jgi:beta-glucosidase
VVERMAELGLVCIVDLIHYGTPLWLENSFLHPDYPKRVADYAAAAADRYRDLLHVWTPLNEPAVNAEYCGEKGLWPPYLMGQSGFTAVLAQLAEGICRTQAAIAATQPDASFVHVDAGFRYEGADAPMPLDVLLRRRFLALDLVTGRVDRTHPLAGWLAGNGFPEERLAWLGDHAVRPDVVGVNYYPAFTTVRYDAAGQAHPVEAGTAGLEDLIRLYDDRYGLPVMVTETSRAGTVQERRAWLRDSLACVEALRAQGIPLVGYTWFPFIALVDWLYRESCAPVDDWLMQMGQVDLARIPGGGALERRPTPLVDDFAEACRRGMPAIKD